MTRPIALLLATLVTQSAQASTLQELYAPPTKNLDDFDAISLLDLDQRSIVGWLAKETTEGMNQANRVFEQGAYAASYAWLTITDSRFTQLDVPAGTLVAGSTASGTPVQGICKTGSLAGDPKIIVHYQINQDTYHGLSGSRRVCAVGGNPNPITAGCFAEKGQIRMSITPGDPPLDFSYEYDSLLNNINGLSLSKLGAEFPGSMSSTVEKYTTYYGTQDYDTKWLESAFGGTMTSGFTNGIMEFSKLDLEGREAAVRWGIVILATFRFVAGAVEDAVAQCSARAAGTTVAPTDLAVARWDQAVAAFVGSEPWVRGGDGGYFLYTLIQGECENFGTCNLLHGTADLNNNDGLAAPLNESILNAFSAGRGSLQRGDCAGAQIAASRVVSQTTVPLIQGLLRSSHNLDLFNNKQGITQGQAAAYAAALAPLMHDCSAGNAYILMDDLAPGKAAGASFEVVKGALERAYDCLGVTCEDVGGLLTLMGDQYEKGAEPCGAGFDHSSSGSGSGSSTGAGQYDDDVPAEWKPRVPTQSPVPKPSTTSTQSKNKSGSGNNNGLVIGLSVAAGVVALLIAVLAAVFEGKKKQFDTARDPTSAGQAATQAAASAEEDTNVIDEEPIDMSTTSAQIV